MVLSHCAAMPRSWVTMMRVLPYSCWRRSISSKTCWARSRSSAPVGSSARDQIPGLQYASCEGDALLFTAGEGHDLVSRDMAESEPGEHGLGLALPDLFAVTGEAHAEGDVVKGAHVVVGGCGCGQAISWKTFRRDWRELASAGVDEGAEDATLVAIGAVRELRMPLDGPRRNAWPASRPPPRCCPAQWPSVPVPGPACESPDGDNC